MIRLVLVLTLFVITANMVFQDEINETSEYASMVCAGHWPDYENLNPECGE